MKLNRIIFVVLIAVFLMPNIIAQETKAAFEEDFNGFAVGTQPAGMDPRETDSTGKVRVQAVPSDEDKSLLLENTAVSDSQAFIQKQLSAALSGSVEINFRMMVESTTKRLTLPMLRDGGNNNCTLLNLEPSGKRSVGKVALEDYTFGAWEDYRIAIDFSSNSFNFYINGKKAAEGVALPANLENLILIRFQIQNVIAKVYLDNISIYQGGSGERAEVAPPPEQSGETVFFTEGFDGYATGDKPALPLASRVVGDAAAAVLEEPDARNKSLFLRSGGPDGTAYVQYEFPSVQREAFTVDFKLMLPSAQNLRLLILMDGKGAQTAVMDIRANQLIIGESQAASLETGKWHQVKITVQPAQKKYSLSLDGEQIVRGAALSGQLTEVKRLRFQAAQNEQMFYLDELTAASGSTQSVQTYPSALFLTAVQQEAVNEILSGAFAMSCGSRKAYLNGQVLWMENAAPEKKGGVIFVPLRFAAGNLGGKVVWNEETKTAVASCQGKTVKFMLNEARMCLDGSGKAMEAAPRQSAGTLLVPAKAFAEAFGLTMCTEKNLILFGCEPLLYEDAEQIVKQEVMNMVKYTRPTGEQMLKDLESYSKNNAHPRLLATSEQFEQIKQRIQTDETAAKMFEYLKMNAESVLMTAPAEYSLKENNLRLGPAVTLVPSRVEVTALMYRLTGDEKYAQRAWEELESACEFPDWNQKHYLDTGGMMAAAAIGYDWLYDYLSEAQREKLRNALLEKGVKIGLDSYRGKYNAVYLMSFWINSPYNWNAHCNAGLVMASLAIGNEAPEITGPVLEYAMRSFEYAANEFEPDGAWEEGPSYWNTNVQDDVRIISSLETALGTEYGYFNIPGIRETCYYPVYIMGPDGTFNYSDSDKTKRLEIQHQFWMAEHLPDPNLGYLRKTYIAESNYKCTPSDLIWYRPEYCAQKLEDLDTDRYFRKVETATMRSSWDNEAMFVGFHSGNTDIPHSHLDTGSFVLDYGGVRWIEDLGTDRITYTGTGGYRAYRSRAEGHNTLVMDNSGYKEEGTPQDENGWPVMLSYSFDDIETGGQPGLDVREGGSGTVKVVEQPDQTNKSLRIACADKESGTQAFIQQPAFDPALKTGARIDFRFLREDLNGTVSFPAIRDADRNEFSLLELKEDGSLCAYNGEKAVPLQKYEANQWYDVRISLDIKGNKMDVWIDGQKAAEGFAFRKALSDLSLLRIAVYRQPTALLLDDLVMYLHPDDGGAVVKTGNQQDQNAKAYCKITRYESKPRGALAVTDMTDAYKDYAKSAVRGVLFTNNRRELIVRDEVNLKTRTDLWWFAHTKADITLSADGKSAVLSEDGKQLWVGILSGGEAKFEVMDAKPLETSPNPDGQVENKEFRKLAIHLSGVREADISVAFVPLNVGEGAPESLPAEQKISEWAIPDGEIPKLDEITVDDRLIREFQQDKAFYNITIEEGSPIPEIGAAADGAQLQVSQARQVPGAAEIQVTKNGVTAMYSVHIDSRKTVASTIGGYPITEYDILASAIPEPENPPEATLDGNLETRYAVEGMGQWIQFDLHERKRLEKIDLAWFRGAERVYSFEIQLSSDGVNWNQAFKGESSGKTGDVETYSFPPQEARFIKIIGYGSNVNAWNNIAEVR